MVVQDIYVFSAVLGVQPEVVHKPQGHNNSPGAVILVMPATWLEFLVHLGQPVMEGEESLDVSLADTAPRASSGLRVGQATRFELLKSILPHEVLAGDNQVSVVSQISIARLPTGRHFHLGKDVVPLLVLTEGTIVPHEALEGGVKLADIVGTPYPGVRGSQAVPTVGIAGPNDEYVVRNRLQERGNEVGGRGEGWGEGWGEGRGEEQDEALVVQSM